MLRDKYLATYYRVNAPVGFLLRVGRPRDELALVMRTFGYYEGCYITAANPESKPLTRAENAVRNESLVKDLMEAGKLLVMPGAAHGPDGWSEESYLVLGLSLVDGQRLGRKYRQNAILWFNSFATPELVMLVESC